MITGAVLFIVGLWVGLSGSLGFKFEQMIAGWVIAGIGVVVFVTVLLSKWVW